MSKLTPEERKSLSNTYYTMRRRKDVDVCDNWKKYSNFEKWAIEHGYQAGARMVRINRNDKVFSPSNTKIVIQPYARNMAAQMKKLMGVDPMKMRIKIL